MDRATVIAALPSLMEDEVYKISSEEVPHLTLLYLGDVELSVEAVLYVQHACRELSPFGMSVEYRGTLGEDDADVLFLEKTWGRRVEEFRHHLLLNDEIKRAYDSAEQHPEWTPHLTLGYPNKPAKDGDESRIRYIDFDRIAVWTGDFDGPEFRLKYDDHAMEVSMSDMTTAERGEQAAAEIFHFGVKGMKWGISRADRAAGHRTTAERNQRIADGTASKKDKAASVWGVGQGGRGGFMSLRPGTAQKLADRYSKKADKLDAKIAAKDAKKAGEKGEASARQVRKDWKKDASSAETANKAFQAAAKDFEKSVDIINNDPNYKGKDLTAPENRGLARDYDRTMATVFNEHLAQRSIDLTMNDQGRAYIYQFDRNTGLMSGREYKAVVEHADDKPFPDYRVELDELGHAVKFDVIIEELGHGHSFEDALAHYGVKGMKWGVTTKSDGSQSIDQTKVRKSVRRSDRAVTVSQRKPGTYVKAKGGGRNVASTDAVKTQANRQRAKKSTTDALSNKQLKDTIERMRLEQEYKKLDAKVSRKGKSFVSRLLSSPEMRQTAADLAKKVAAANG